MTPIIKAANITKNYGQQEVLKGIDLLIAPGDFTCIMAFWLWENHIIENIGADASTNHWRCLF